MANSNLTTPIAIGNRLHRELFAELVNIADAFEKSGDIHEKRRLYAKFQAVEDLIYAATGQDLSAKAAAADIWKKRKSA